MDFSKISTVDAVNTAIVALKANGIEAVLAASGGDAKQKVLAMIPEGSEVMTMTSITLDTLGIAKDINESGKYVSVRAKLGDKDISPKIKREIGAAPDVVVGSVHAVTEDGKVVIASNTGSQLPAYAYAGAKVIWVVGTQKITSNLDSAMKRVYDYVLPLESDRAHKAYGVEASFVSKLLIINKEVTAGRLSIVFVPEAVGF